MTTRIFPGTSGKYTAMKLTVIGSSPAWPNPGGTHSGYLVEHDSTRLLLDCGPGVLSRLRERELWPQLDAIAITHFHLDHCGDLVPWVWGTMYRYEEASGRPRLLVPPGGRVLLSKIGAQFGFNDMFERTFELAEYAEDEPVFVGGLELRAQRVPHYRIETYGFRVSNGKAVLAYSGDSAPSAQLVELARAADLFLCEATLARGVDDGQPRGHLSVEEALQAFRTSQAKRLLLTHRPFELPLDDGLELAYDGLVLDLP